tara:strand:- start:231 stop:1472 length:1242 start_codon:yes stop_codon:yes gene_type:complete
MTEPICPTNSVTPDKYVCNECLLNGCDNCLDRCVPQQECLRKYKVEGNDFESNQTKQVSFIEDNVVPVEGGEAFPNDGLKFVCGVSPLDEGKQYSIDGGGSYSDIDSSDSLEIGVSDNSYDFDENGGMFLVESVNWTDNDPQVEVNPDQVLKFKAQFELDTANESFVLIQDLYRNNFKKYKEFHDAQEGLAPLDIDFYSLRNLDPDSLARNLFNMVKGIYKMNTFDIQTSNLDRKNKRIELDSLRKEIDNKRVLIEDLKEINHTTKRNIEINLNKSRSVKDTNKVLMIVMIIIGFMVIIPILKKFNVMPLNIALVIWCVLLLVLLGYMVYELYMKRANVDALEYKKRNFAKPSDKEIAKSRAMAQLSDKDKARCQAFSELEQELDVPNINLDVSQYYSQPQAEESCAHIPESI